MSVDFCDLVGTRVLDGINRRVSSKDGEEQMVVVLRLNGIAYQFEEDPQDGYRSCLGEITISTEDVVAFEPVIVAVEYHQNPSAFTGLVIKHAIGKRTQLCRVGTNDSDDCYPSFVFEWTPDGLPEMPS